MSSPLKQFHADDFSHNINTIQKDTTDNLYKINQTKSVAEELSDARKKAGHSLEQIATDLRISKHYLQAIEDCALDTLPERVYTLGFIRSYAKYLGLGADDVVKRFKNEILGEATSNAPYVAPKLVAASSMPSRALILSLVVLIVLGAMASWIYSSYIAPQPETAIITPEVITQEIDQSLGYSQSEITPKLNFPNEKAAVIQQQPQNDLRLPISETSIVSSATNAVPSTDAKVSIIETVTTKAAVTPLVAHAITLSFTELAWMEIKDPQGRIMISRDINPGEIYIVTPQAGMKFSTGNAGGIVIKKAGQNDYTLGKHGEVIKDMPFDSRYFMQNLLKP